MSHPLLERKISPVICHECYETGHRDVPCKHVMEVYQQGFDNASGRVNQTIILECPDCKADLSINVSIVASKHKT